MIASTPVRLLSLAIVVVVVIVGVRGIVGGFAFGGDVLDTSPGPGSSAAAGERTPGVVAYLLDEDAVQVTTGDGRDVRVRFLGLSAPEIPHPGKPGECHGSRSIRHLRQLLPAGTHVTLVSDPTRRRRHLRALAALRKGIRPRHRSCASSVRLRCSSRQL